MAAAPLGIGVDGCNGGWAVALLGADDVPRLHVLERIELLPTLLPRVSAARVALVDIPIGLPVHGVREVDGLARAHLGAASSSVFSVPPRPAFDGLDYEEASRLSRAADAGGLTVQAWNIMGKIREVDLWLRRRAGVGVTLRESHPELVFKGFARRAGRPWPLPAKRTAAGRQARCEVLAAHGVDAAAALAQRPDNPAGAVAADDKLDATCLALLSRELNAGGGAVTLPAAPVADAVGLPQEMVLPPEALAGD